MHKPGRPGGWAVVYYTIDDKGNEDPLERSAPNAIPNTDAQEMELRAVVEGLKFALGPLAPVRFEELDKIVLWTDSTYIHDGFKNIHTWSRNQWNRASGAPLLHAERWREIYRLLRRAEKPVIAKWIPGKSSPRAKRVDKLAKEAAKRAPGAAGRVQNIRRHWASDSATAGQVAFNGQELEIRIVGIERMQLARSWRIRFEVIGDVDNGKTGKAFTDEVLLQRNVYRVRVNDNPHYPRIAEVLDHTSAAEHDANPHTLE